MANFVWNGMREKQFKELTRYMRWVADEIGLRDWTLTIRRSPLDIDDDAFARVDCTYGRRLATVTLCKDFAQLDHDVQRHCLLHELLHCHLDPLHSLWANAVPEVVGKAAWMIFDNASRQQIEFAVDALADFLGPKLPLPKVVA